MLNGSLQTSLASLFCKSPSKAIRELTIMTSRAKRFGKKFNNTVRNVLFYWSAANPIEERRFRNRWKWNRYSRTSRTRIGARATRCKNEDRILFYFLDLRQPATPSSRPLLVTASRRRAALSSLRHSAALFSLNMWSVPSSARAHTLSCIVVVRISHVHTRVCMFYANICVYSIFWYRLSTR